MRFEAVPLSRYLFLYCPFADKNHTLPMTNCKHHCILWLNLTGSPITVSVFPGIGIRVKPSGRVCELKMGFGSGVLFWWNYHHALKMLLNAEGFSSAT